MAFMGKWYQTECTGMEEFAKANAADYSKVAAIVAGFQLCGPDGYVEEFAPADGKINRKIFIKGDLKKEATAGIGEEFDGVSWDGRPCKIRVDKEGEGNLVRVEKYADGSSMTSRTKPVSKDEIIMTIEGKGVTCTRTFKRA